MFRLRGNPAPPTTEEQLATIRAHAENARAATELRNRAIRNTRGRPGLTLEAVANASGLTVSRVKQLRGSDPSDPLERADGPAITDLDQPVLDTDSPGRIWGLTDIAPDIPVYESEREFLATGRGRHGSDLGWEYYDDDRIQRFVISTASSPNGGIDIYAFAAGEDNTSAHTSVTFTGSSSGPCYLLGNVPNPTIIDKLIFPPLIARIRRPGALAWAYMRIRTITEVLQAMDEEQGH